MEPSPHGARGAKIEPTWRRDGGKPANKSINKKSKDLNIIDIDGNVHLITVGDVVLMGEVNATNN